MKNAALALLAASLTFACTEPGSRSAGQNDDDDDGGSDLPIGSVDVDGDGALDPPGSAPVYVGRDAAGQGLCGDDVAATTFRFGLCTCEDIGFSTVLRVDGSVGTNGAFTSTGDSDIGGSLVVGTDALPIGHHEVGGDLQAGGSVTAAGDIDVDGDAWVSGNIGGFVVDVGGVLHTPADSSVGFGISAGSTVNEPVAVTPPCPCGASDRIDVAGFIADAAVNNDNAAIGLERESLLNVFVVDLALPAGRYYLSGVRAAGSVTLKPTGPVAVYIDGDLELAGVLEVIPQNASAEVDIFVAGALLAAGDFDLGTRGDPATVRTWIAGASDITLAGDLDLGGNLWAPEARLIAAGDLDVRGNILVGSLLEAGVIHIRDGGGTSTPDGCDTPIDDDADEDDVDDGAPPVVPSQPAPVDDPTPGCATCEDCGNQACNDGVCGACATSLDCCAPGICVEGSCVNVGG
jgi:cytoskeletal protein CcmA (bactofilin family)